MSISIAYIPKGYTAEHLDNRYKKHVMSNKGSVPDHIVP